LEPISMPSYTDKEKIAIGKYFMLPKLLKKSGIPEGSFTIEDEAWAKITRPLGFDAGMRTLERTINGIVRKVARKMVQGEGQSYTITAENAKEYLPR